MRISSRKPPACVGLDIGRHSVKLVRLSNRRGTLHADCALRLPLPPGAINDSAIGNPFQVTETIARALDQTGMRSAGRCTVAVSGPAVMTRILHVPQGLADDEMEGFAELEARRHIPFPRHELSLDFAVLGQAEHDPEQLEVLLVAARLDVVRARREVAEAAGLKVAAVTIEAVAIANALKWMRARQVRSETGVCGVIDLGAGKTTLVVMCSDRLSYWREHSVDDSRPGGSMERVGQVMQSYASADGSAPLEAVYLAGGGAGDDTLAAQIARHWALPCHIADPLAGSHAMTPSANPQMMVACGLALHEAFA